MKKILFLISVCCVSVSIAAQSPMAKGQAQLNAGVGLSSWGYPAYLGLDFAIHKDITIGGELSFRSYRENWWGAKGSRSAIGVSANANYHFNSILQLPSPWDFYAGINTAYFIWNTQDPNKRLLRKGFGYAGQVGCRYFISNNVGLNFEVGGGSAFSGGKLGLTIKL